MSFNSISVTNLSDSDDESYEAGLARQRAEVETLLRQQEEKERLERQARKEAKAAERKRLEEEAHKKQEEEETRQWWGSKGLITKQRWKQGQRGEISKLLHNCVLNK